MLLKAVWVGCRKWLCHFRTGLLLEVYFFGVRLLKPSVFVFFFVLFFLLVCFKSNVSYSPLWHLKHWQDDFKGFPIGTDGAIWLQVSERAFASRRGFSGGGVGWGRGVEALWSPRFCSMFAWSSAVRVLRSPTRRRLPATSPRWQSLMWGVNWIILKKREL